MTQHTESDGEQRQYLTRYDTNRWSNVAATTHETTVHDVSVSKVTDTRLTEASRERFWQQLGEVL